MELHVEVKKLLEDCVRIRRSLHKIPETGFEEFMTGRYIKAELEKTGPDKLESLAGTGIKAVYYAENAEKTIAFRADMDGLNLEELCQTEYKSEREGCMHGCGHDGHMTVLLLLSMLIHKYRHQLKVNVVLLFQPAEEGKGGAKLMIAAGALENPKVDLIYGLHLWPDVPKGKFGMRWGPLMAMACEFDITVIGRSAHGASPQEGVDAVVAAGSLITLLQTIISRDIDPHKDALLTIGKISGGVARNVIADRVEMNATLRVFDQQVYDHLIKRIYSMASGISVATGAVFEINELMHYPCVDNPRYLVEDFYRYLDIEDIVIHDAVLAAEDFACYQKEIPGLFFFLGAGGGKNSAPLHNGNFDFDESALLYGVEAYRRLLGLADA